MENFFMPDNFRYCPKCSAAALRPSSPKSIRCSECGFEYFFNAAGAVAALIVNQNGELLVTVRAHDPHKGKLDLPGGFIDPGESAEHALAREIKEELNLDIEDMQYVASAPTPTTINRSPTPPIDMAFTGRIDDFSTCTPKTTSPKPASCRSIKSTRNNSPSPQSAASSKLLYRNINIFVISSEADQPDKCYYQQLLFLPDDINFDRAGFFGEGDAEGFFIPRLQAFKVFRRAGLSAFPS